MEQLQTLINIGGFLLVLLFLICLYFAYKLFRLQEEITSLKSKVFELEINQMTEEELEELKLKL